MDVATKKEWLQSLREEPHKHDRWVFVPRIILVLIFLGGIALWAGKVFAEPIAQAKAGEVTITVYNEKCTHQDVVKNLPMRATWAEGGKVYDGCVGAISELGIAMFYFDDHTMAVVPIQMFAKLTNA